MTSFFDDQGTYFEKCEINVMHGYRICQLITKCKTCHPLHSVSMVSASKDEHFFRRITAVARRFIPVVTSFDVTARLPRMQFRYSCCSGVSQNYFSTWVSDGKLE